MFANNDTFRLGGWLSTSTPGKSLRILGWFESYRSLSVYSILSECQTVNQNILLTQLLFGAIVMIL
jgi:hypothetical protein